MRFSNLFEILDKVKLMNHNVSPFVQNFLLFPLMERKRERTLTMLYKRLDFEIRRQTMTTMQSKCISENQFLNI